MQEEIREAEDSQDLYEHYRFEVDPGQSAMRIDKFLTQKIENITRNRIQNAAKAGSIMVNGISVKSNYKIKPHDVVAIVMAYPPREIEIIPQDIPINIVYQDDDLAVIDKEAGMVVHPGHGNYSGTLINALAHHFKDAPLYHQDDIRPGLVHRIDKNTSGLLVVAKNELAFNKLAKQFFDHSTKREYLAMVWGVPKEEKGTITGHIGRDPKDKLKMMVFPDGSYGKEAITHYELIESFGYVSLVRCRLETGRTHQIRAHMRYINHPLFNDERYGGDKILKGTTFTKYKQFVQNCFTILPRHALHARTLGFIHPSTGREMLFESPLPNDMKNAIDKWRKYTENRDFENE